MKMLLKIPGIFVASSSFWISTVFAEATPEEIAKKLVNPLAYMISVPFEYNYDQKLGPEENGTSQFVKIQPIIPRHINESWDLISRPILPVMWDHNVDPGENVTGIGTLQYESFFVPAGDKEIGVLWGLGPYLAFPTATNEVLGSNQYQAGLSGVLEDVTGPWTIGLLAFQAWAYAASGDWDNQPHDDVLYMQPYIAYVSKSAWTYKINSETYYYWNSSANDQWAVPFNAEILKLYKFGEYALNFGLGARYWATDTTGQAQGWGARATLTFAFPE
jgi:hypothetical protein